MTTFIKTKFKISDDQTNIDNGLAANITSISDLESPSNFQVKGKKIFKSVHKQGNYTFVDQRVILGKKNIGFGIPIKFSSQRNKIIQICP